MKLIPSLSLMLKIPQSSHATVGICYLRQRHLDNLHRRYNTEIISEVPLNDTEIAEANEVFEEELEDLGEGENGPDLFEEED